jgi:hypothetical protein
LNTTTGRFYFYYDSVWVDTSSNLGGQAGPTGPTGADSTVEGPTGPTGPTGPGVTNYVHPYFF